MNTAANSNQQRLSRAEEGKIGSIGPDDYKREGITMKVEIISIGTELLYNDVVDVNAARATTCLRELQIDLTCKVTVGDYLPMIVQAIGDALRRADVVLTIGGLGNDDNDFTRQAILHHLDIAAPDFEASIPGAKYLGENEPGPYGYLLPLHGKTMICLPGGRRKVAHLLETDIVPFLKAKQEQGISYSGGVLLHTAGLVESDIRQRLEPIRLNGHEQIMLHTFAGQTDIRLWIEAHTPDQVDSRLETLKHALYSQLGDHIYGEGETRLEQVVLELLRQRRLSLTIVENDTGQILRRFLLPFMGDGPAVTFLPAHSRADVDALLDFADDELGVDLTRWSRKVASRLREQRGTDLGLVVLNQVLAGGMQLMVTLASPKGISLIQRSFGGHPDNIADWTVTLSLVLLRRWLLANPEPTYPAEFVHFHVLEQASVPQ